MGMGFLSSIRSAADAAPPLPAADAGDPIARFTFAAAEVGLIRPGDKLDRNVVELCLRVVEMAALVGDRYPISGFIEDSVGRRIRDELLE
ncbi:MAG TPA: hypothetical protein VGI11_19945 [Variovorax sp.]